jgi:hypothetical protein
MGPIFEGLLADRLVRSRYSVTLSQSRKVLIVLWAEWLPIMWDKGGARARARSAASCVSSPAMATVGSPGAHRLAERSGRPSSAAAGRAGNMQWPMKAEKTSLYSTRRRLSSIAKMRVQRQPYEGAGATTTNGFIPDASH